MSTNEVLLPDTIEYLARLNNTTPTQIVCRLNDKPKTIRFNRYLWSEHPEVDETAHQIIETVCAGLIPVKADRQKLHATAKIIVLNLYCAYRAGMNYWVSFSRNKNVVNVPVQYRKSGLNYKHLKLLTDGLCQRQMILLRMGFYDRSRYGNTPVSRSRQSKMKAEPVLVQTCLHRIKLEYLSRDSRQELIELKDTPDDDDNKHLQAYEDTAKVARMRRILRDYNILIKSSEIKLSGVTSPLVDFSDTTVKRVFNNSSWTKGGRFYGGWWLNDIKSKSRHDITINGNPTVELDYKALHPFMLYQRKGIRLDFDPYQLPHYDNHPEKKKLRNLAKDYLLICLNASFESKALMAMRKKIREDKENEDNRYPDAIPNLRELANRLKQHNAPITDYFCKGTGLRLQYRDSCIAERIIKIMTSENKVVLCLHDGFRCEAIHEEQLKELMAESYMKIMETDYYPAIEKKTLN